MSFIFYENYIVVVIELKIKMINEYQRLNDRKRNNKFNQNKKQKNCFSIVKNNPPKLLIII